MTNSSNAADRLFSRPDNRSVLWASGGDRGFDHPSVTLFNMDLANVSLEQAVRSLVSAAASKSRTTAFFVNAHSINCSENDPGFTRVLNRADVRYADGSGMAVAAKIAGRSLRDNVNGTDMLPLLAAESARKGLSIYLYGARPGTAEKAAANLLAEYPALTIAGCDHGYHRHGSAEEAAAIERINASGADILLVALGVPTQELWLSRNCDRLRPSVRLGVGGLFDYFSGNVSRAPLLFRRFGMEWIWRVLKEPFRLGKRYLIGNVTFLRFALRRRIWGHDVDRTRRNHRIRYVLRVFRGTATMRQSVLRRAIDLAICLPALVAAAPLMALICAAIRWDSRGAALFRQTRIGARGRPFTIYKFRTMVTGAEKQHTSLQGDVSDARDIRFKATDDPRVTRIGRLLRRTSLDELPQLLNVVRGEMSIVGPRPALPTEVRHYTLEQRERLLVKPGITCVWQISGRADLDFVEQVALDRKYARERTVFADISIIAKTIPAVLYARGAY